VLSLVGVTGCDLGSQCQLVGVFTLTHSLLVVVIILLLLVDRVVLLLHILLLDLHVGRPIEEVIAVLSLGVA
jgi:hypothetical protein